MTKCVISGLFRKIAIQNHVVGLVILWTTCRSNFILNLKRSHVVPKNEACRRQMRMTFQNHQPTHKIVSCRHLHRLGHVIRPSELSQEDFANSQTHTHCFVYLHKQATTDFFASALRVAEFRGRTPPPPGVRCYNKEEAHLCSNIFVEIYPTQPVDSVVSH